LVAAVTIAALAGGVHGATISFQVVSGVFTSSDSATTTYSSGNAIATVSFVKNAATQTFTGVIDNETRNVTDFGTFSVHIPPGDNGSINNISDEFKLTIMLIDPASASGFTTADVTGRLKNGDDTRKLTITFDDLTLPSSGLPDVVFTFGSVTLSDEEGKKLAGTATYHAAPAAAAPLPGVAAAGLSLLGLLALARRRISMA
jgi:hypothetical protein